MRCTSNCKSHFAARQIGNAAHWINRFVRGPGGHQNTLPRQHFGCGKSNDVIKQLVGLQHAAVTRLAAGLKANAHTQHHCPIALQLSQIALRCGVRIHFAVHGGRNQKRHSVYRSCETHQTEQVIRPTVQQLGHEISATRRDDDGIGFARQIDVRHVVVLSTTCPRIPLAGKHRAATQRLHRHRRDELLGRLGHYHLHCCAGFD